MESFFVELKGRSLVRVSGPDRRTFLQGLLTNDVEALAPGGLIYACLLTAQGKFLHDMFLREQGDEIWMDCEGGDRAADLLKKLTMYKLRADVRLDMELSVTVYAGMGEAPQGAFADPRHAGMGWRAYEKPQDIPQKPFEEWDMRRISLTIPDGSRDLIVGSSTMDEGNMDFLNAVSYEKGCYVGQELTARMHYRGLAKRRLQAVRLADVDESSVDIRSRCGDIGLALMPVKS